MDSPRPISLPSTARGTSLSPGNRRCLKPGTDAVIRIEVREPTSSDAPWAALTPRQFEVLQCLVEGQPTKLICRQLSMSEGTAKIHISAILRTFNVRNRAEAVIAALRAGWIQPIADKPRHQDE
jgi:DNA-binding NarL/FixJ family response regulator